MRHEAGLVGTGDTIVAAALNRVGGRVEELL